VKTKSNATVRLNKLAAERMGNGEQIWWSTGAGPDVRGWICRWSAAESAWIGRNEAEAAEWIEDHLSQILQIFSELCPSGEVRVVPEPLRRPCDDAVVVGGSYTVAAPSLEGWAEVATHGLVGLDFSAAFEEVFGRDRLERMLEVCTEEKQRLAIEARIATNVALDMAVAAILTPRDRHVRLQHQYRWVGLYLDDIVCKIQAYADRIKRSVAYDFGGIDVVCHPSEAPATAFRLWHEALKARK
jgi:hypothetical protein